MLQRRRGVFQRDAVNAQRDNLREFASTLTTSRSGVPSLRCSLSRRVKENHARARGYSARSAASADLRKRRQRFAGQQVSARIQQRFHARTVEGSKLLCAAHVIAAIL
jgi:hypothetical protein